jgi:23S rRNA (guanosine2251-2'-O)-methyltransferase
MLGAIGREHQIPAPAESTCMEAFPFRATAQSKQYDGIAEVPACFVLDRVRSLYNVGSFFRICDGAGIHKLYLTGYTGFPPHRGISKTALGAEESVSWEHQADADAVVDRLQASGHEVAVIETSSRAVDLYDWRPRFPVCLVFGNEVDGVSPELAARADVQVRIPALGTKQSLNVAVAGGVVAYELLRKYRELHVDG